MRIPLALLLCALPGAALADSDPILDAMQAQLERSWAALQALDEPPYFVGLQVVEVARHPVFAEDGALQGTNPDVSRWVHADVRVGSRQLDSWHPLRDVQWDDSAPPGRELGLGEDPAVLAAPIAAEIDARYRVALDRWQRVQSDQQVLVADEARGPDFAPVQPEVDVGPVAGLRDLPIAAWQDAALQASRAFADSVALDPSVAISADAETRWFVSTEGHRLREGRTLFRASVDGDLVAPDGDHLAISRSFDAASPDGLPDAAGLTRAVREVVAELETLRDAPTQEPYRGPVLLSGQASAVFFHEIFGHRVEGQRLKQVYDAQTFLSQVGESILPPWLSVVDDPTRRKLGDQDLRGFYRYDDQGVEAEAVPLVTDGVFNGFLESRASVGARSNGHGRRAPGHFVFARQGNLIVEASETVSSDELRRRARELAKAQGLDYVLAIDDIEGGFTFTGRDIPNAFQIDVVSARRIWLDGRPDEPVRGIDLIGTPLQTFGRIVAAGPDVKVFNGTCGAESGWVPVAAASPALLVEVMETQRALAGQELPPSLEPPTVSEGDLAAVLRSEIDRAQAQLQLPGARKPGWIVAAARDEVDRMVIADFGSLRRVLGGPARPGRVEVVVGDEAVNSMRVIGSVSNLPGARQRPRFAVGDAARAIARDLWITLDDSYKAALQRLAFKEAALQQLRDDAPPDLAPAPPVVVGEAGAPPEVDVDHLTALATSASAALRGHGLRAGRAYARSTQGHDVVVDTRGLQLQLPDGFAALVVQAERLRPDGLLLTDSRRWVARTERELPSPEQAAAAATAMAEHLAARAAAEPVAWYEGPVVFEGEAAADVLRYLLPEQLRGTPPAPDDDRRYQQRILGGPRLGRRVLPDGWTVRDDPRSVPDGLPGGFTHDREGVPAQAVELVEDGRVVDFVMSRVPRHDKTASNGHARGPIQQEWSGRLSSWVAQPRKLLSLRAFERQVQAARRASRLDALLVVRRLSEGFEGDLPNPAEAVWRAADGTETPVLELEFQGVDRRLLRAAVAGGVLQTRAYLASDHPGGMASSVRGLPMTLRAPDRLLIEEIEAVFPGGGEPLPMIPQPTP